MGAYKTMKFPDERHKIMERWAAHCEPTKGQLAIAAKRRREREAAARDGLKQVKKSRRRRPASNDEGVPVTPLFMPQRPKGALWAVLAPILWISPAAAENRDVGNLGGLAG